MWLSTSITSLNLLDCSEAYIPCIFGIWALEPFTVCGHYIVHLPVLNICLCACVSNKPLSLCAFFVAEPQSYVPALLQNHLAFVPVLLQSPNSLCVWIVAEPWARTPTWERTTSTLKRQEDLSSTPRQALPLLLLGHLVLARLIFLTLQRILACSFRPKSVESVHSIKVI